MNQDQERFRVFADLVPVCFAESDAQGRITFINRAGVALHGFADAAAALGTPVIELLHPDDRPRALENFRRRRIVRAHQGAIEVETAKGRGSTFRVWLPAAEALPARPDAPPEVEAWHGSGKVLLVDDEPDVREVACALLQHAGFDVIATGDGAEALALYDRERDGLVAVILDLTMPPPSGPEIHAALEQRGNTVPVVVTSGYLAREALARFSPPGPEAFLHKPFGLADLEGALRRVLRPPPTLVRGGHLL